jgi:hypothetical protein
LITLAVRVLLLLLSAGLGALGMERVGRPASFAEVALVLLLPGVVLVDALGIRRPKLEQLLYAVGLSIGVVIPLGFALDVTQIGIYRTSIAIGVAGVSCLIVVAAIARGAPSPLVEVESRVRISVPVALMTLVAVGIAASAVAIALHSARNQKFPGFTQFAAVRASASSRIVDLSVSNREGSNQRYTVRAGGARTSRRIAVVALSSGAAWSHRLRLSVVSCERPTTLTLWRGAATEPYRSVTLAPPFGTQALFGRCTARGD